MYEIYFHHAIRTSVVWRCRRVAGSQTGLGSDVPNRTLIDWLLPGLTVTNLCTRSTFIMRSAQAWFGVVLGLRVPRSMRVFATGPLWGAGGVSSRERRRVRIPQVPHLVTASSGMAGVSERPHQLWLRSLANKVTIEFAFSAHGAHILPAGSLFTGPPPPRPSPPPPSVSYNSGRSISVKQRQQ